MKQFTFFSLCLAAAMAMSLGVGTAAAQGNIPVVQNGPSRPAISRSAPASKPVANASIAQPRVLARPTGFIPRTVTSYTPRITTQPAATLRPDYSPQVATSGPTFATLTVPGNARKSEQEPITLDPTTRQTELRTFAEIRARQRFEPQNRTLAALNPHRDLRTDLNPQRHFSTGEPAIHHQPQTAESPENTTRKHWHNKKDHRSYADAFRSHWHEWHDHHWWHDHCQTIVYINTGYYFLDGSYWYPAWGYNPLQTYYDYDGPVYTYGDLLPDEVIANVQTALQDNGYYSGGITGSLDGETRAALANFQRDYGLPITGAIDEPTVETLGLSQTDETSSFQTDQGY
ncbi:MAG TPA: peptidoglycan-binding protein [Candidatus Udaeobacter sp.]|nr:peptidoglycan-binding protein [Candidatus Udaeobacter sp.]